MGYDPYPVVRERLPDPSSGTAPDTTFESENRISSHECSGNSWKRGSEPVIRSRFGNASEFPRIRPDPGRIFRLGNSIYTDSYDILISSHFFSLRNNNSIIMNCWPQFIILKLLFLFSFFSF